MSDVTVFIQRRLTSGKSASKDKDHEPETYFGAWETFENKATGGHEHLETLQVMVNSKGQVVAVMHGQDVLAFVKTTVDEQMAKTFAHKYGRGLAARVSKLTGIRPRVR